MNDLLPAPVGRQGSMDSPFGWLRTEMDRLFDDLGRPARGLFNFGVQGFGPVPAMEMSEHADKYRLAAELPGLNPEDVSISVADGMLILSGEKRETIERKDDQLLLNERRYGAFERRLSLPSDVDENAISAEFKHGLLTVTLPRSQDTAKRRHRIEIKSQS